MSVFDPTNPSDPTVDPDGSSQQQRLVTLMKHLFRQMAADKSLDTEQMQKCRIRDFVYWCNDNKDQWCTPETKYEVAAGLKIHIEDVDTLERMFSDPYDAVGLCISVWYMLTLSGHEPPKHLPDFTHIAVTLGFDQSKKGEEKAFQIQVPVKFKPGTPLTDGFIVALLADQMRAIAQTLSMGMDMAYEKYAVNVSDQRGKIVREPIAPEDRNRENSDGT